MHLNEDLVGLCHVHALFDIKENYYQKAIQSLILSLNQSVTSNFEPSIMTECRNSYEMNAKLQQDQMQGNQ